MKSFMSIGRFGGMSALLFVMWCGAPVGAAAPVDLGTAGNFTVLAKTGVSTTGPTMITGHVGVSPATATALTGFGLVMDGSGQYATSSRVNGRLYAADYTAPTPSVLTAAIGDMQIAYTDVAGRTLPDSTELGAGNIGGMTLAPGLYKWSSAVIIPTDVTLSGGANAVWIFQVAQTLDISNATKVLLAGGAQARNIFWQVAGQVTLGTTAVFNGNILGQTAIVLNTGATLNGRALAQSAVTIDAGTLVSSAGGYDGPNPPGKGQTFAYPSPARGGVVHIVYFMPDAGKAAVRVWSERGDLVATAEEFQLPGPQKTRLNIGDFASGVYLYRVNLTYDSGVVEKPKVGKFAVAR